MITIIAIHSIIVEFFKSYEKGVEICNTVSAAIEINGIGPPRNPKPKVSPSAPPKVDIAKTDRRAEIIKIIFGLKNI